jgi:DNA-binding CsgD family transcriptional regulator
MTTEPAPVGGAPHPPVAGRDAGRPAGDYRWPVRVPSDLPGWRRAAELAGRRTECGVLDTLIGAVRTGGSRALVLHGEPGIGKTALLEYLAVRSSGCRVARGTGVQSEMELAFSGLHQLCAPMLDRLDRLPGPQRDALRTVFGISAGPPPDRFLVGLAVLSLLSDVAEGQPLMCLVDDQQWLDACSAQVLAFVARRLGAESVGLVFATRAVGDDLAGLPELAVTGLRAQDAGALLDAVLTGPIDARVRDQIVAETRGNPLALLELPRGLSPADLAGGFGLPGAPGLSGSIEETFGQRAAALPAAARRLLLVAAGDPSGDSALVDRAAALLGIGEDDRWPAVDSGLAEFGTRVRFRHPLARSAVYRSAGERERRQAHAALAAATDAAVDPDRRAWHRAEAAAGPDEDVAAELARSAGRARARGGLAATAAFLRRAATLTPDAALRAGRALAAAQAKIQAGGFAIAGDLLAMAETGPLSEVERAQADLLRARLAYVTNRGSDAPLLLLAAARRLQPIDAAMSRATLLDALLAAIFAGRLAAADGDVLTVARAVRTEQPAHSRAPDLLLDGTAAGYTDGYVAGLPMLRLGLARFGAGMSVDEQLRWLYLACITALRVWDDTSWDALSARQVELARAVGQLSDLPLALVSRAYLLLFSGDLAGAAALVDEAQAVEEATGGSPEPYGPLGLAAFRGDEAAALPVIDAAVADVTRRGEGQGITFAQWAKAVLYNGIGRYPEALAAARCAAEYDADIGSLVWVWPELVEAAVRSDQAAVATGLHRRFTEITEVAGTDWALGMRLRSQAMLADGAVADDLYRESIDRLARTRMRVQHARAHLLYGEWLRRRRRTTEARDHLRTAHGMLASMGIGAFAERAGRELRAAGGTVRGRATGNRHDELTAQEAQIARMARDGLSNPEIGTRLFISARTVQYHLRKVFTKLGVTSRGQLEQALPHEP